MAADFGLVALTLAAAAASAGTAAAGAVAKNKAKDSAKDSARRAAVEKRSQIEDAADLERLKRKREADQIRGRLAAIGGASGADPAGSYSTLETQVGTNADYDLDIIERNRRNNIARTHSDLDAQFTSLSEAGRNPILDGFTGGLQGASTGLSLYSAIPNAPINPATAGPLT